MTSCQHCARKTALPLCTPCTQNLANLLAELPWLLHQLDITITRQDHLHNGGTNHSHTPNPVNVGAMELMRDTSRTLHQIALDVAQIHGSERIPALVNASPSQVAVWLRDNLNAIQRHDRAGEHYHHIQDIVGDTKPGQIHQAINRPDTVFTGPCPTIRTHNQHGEPIRCNHILWAHEGEQFTTCPRCGCPIDVEQNKRRAAAENDHLPLDVIYDVINNIPGEHVDKSELNAWARTRALLPHGYLTRTGIQKHFTRHSDPRVYSLTTARRLAARRLAAQTTSV